MPAVTAKLNGHATPSAGTTQCPVPGVYPRVPFETYVSWPALNHSTLRHMARSPRHFKHALDHPDKSETDSKRFGTAAHCLVLEPARFAGDVVRAPINEKTGRPYGSDTKAWAEYAALRPGKIVMTDEEIADLKGLSDAVFADEDAAALLGIKSGLSEVCIVWDCPITGLRCKGRVDRWIPRENKRVVRVDVKSTECADWSEFSHSVVKYGYHTQEAFYAIGCRALGFDGDGGLIVAAESAAPYGINVATIDDDTVAIGDKLVREWLGRVKHCLSTGLWPGYFRPCPKFKAPEWYFKRFADGLD